jgi:hypothetical protein
MTACKEDTTTVNAVAGRAFVNALRCSLRALGYAYPLMALLRPGASTSRFLQNGSSERVVGGSPWGALENGSIY